MNQRETALQFLKYFCAGEWETLCELLTEDFQLKGPLFEFRSRDEYLASLEEGSAAVDDFHLLHLFENGADVCAIYDLIKPDSTLAVAQIFEFRGDRIARTRLIFDGRAFV